jgi:K+-sensing histidine kinase KdpD
MNDPSRLAVVASTDIWPTQQMERLYAHLSADLVEVASYEDLLVRVTRLPVPDLADFCVLDLNRPDGRAERVAGTHADPERQALVDTLLRYPPQPRPNGVVEVLHTGAPLLIAELADETLAELAQDERHLATLRALAPRSVMVVPLAARGSIIGALTLTLATPERRYTPRDLAMTQEVGVRIALALENAQLHSVTQQHAVRMQVLAEVSRRFAEAHPSLPEVLEQVSDELAHRIGSCCVIRLLSADRQWLEPVAVAHPNEEARAHLRQMAAQEPYHISDGLTGWVAQRGESVLIAAPDPETMRRVMKPEYASFADRYGVASLMVAPLRARGEVIGTIMMLRDTAQRPYTRDDQLLLEDIADRAALAINHARLYDNEQRARATAERNAQRLAVLQTVTALLSTALTIDQVAAVTVHQGVAALGADAGSLLLLEPDGETLRIAAASGYSREVVERWRSFPSSLATPLGDAVRSGAPVWLESRDAYTARYPLMSGSESVRRDSAWAALPLKAGARVLGALGLSFASPTPFSADDRSFTMSLAQQCAQAFERAQLFEAERQSRAEAEAAVRVREQFLSVAAHELKTPLTPLMGQAQLLLRRMAVGAPVEERFRISAEMIVSQARRLSRLVAGLLDLNRLQTGRLELARAPVDLGVLARRIADEMLPSLAQHTLLVEIAADPLIVSADALRLEQVLHNLLQNAAKYSPLGGTIWLLAAREDARALVAVRDQGIGIPPEAIPQLFQPFYRAANAKDSSVMGMGIGLAVVKELVELHGGSVQVESTEGAGSTFTVRLPLAAP